MPEARPSHLPAHRLTAFETTLFAGGIVLFMVLLYAMRAILDPPTIGAATIILLWPLRHHTVVRALMLSGAFLLGFWFLEVLSSVLLPFVAVYLLAYLFDPAVLALQRRLHVPRWISSLLFTALMVGLVVLFVLLIVPNLVSQFEVLAGRLIEGITGLRTWIETSPVLDNLEQTGLIDKNELIAQLSAFAQEQATSLASSLPNAVQNLFSQLSSLLALLTTVTILPVVLFYTLKDYPFIKPRLVELFPTFGGRRDYLVKAGGIVGNYLRGQLLISAIAAFNVSVVLLLLDVPFALLIGLVGGLFNMIPNLGIILTNIIGVTIAVIFGDPWLVDALIVLGVLFAQSLFEGAVLTPNILGHQVGLHPVLILLSLFVFGYFMGALGLLIAVPATALIMTAYKSYRGDVLVAQRHERAADEAAG